MTLDRLAPMATYREVYPGESYDDDILLRLTGGSNVAGSTDLGGHDDQGAKRPSQATQLVELALEWYDLGQSPSGEAFAVRKDGAYVARLLRGGKDSLRAELAAAYVKEHGRVPASSALADAMLTLQGHAQQTNQ